MSLSTVNPGSTLGKMLSKSVLALTVLLGACGELPVEGPLLTEVETQQRQNNTSGFVLIDLTAEVADYLKTTKARSFNDRFGKGKPFKSRRIGIGDTLAVQIWEADPTGLFSSAGAVNRGQIPEIVVDNTGRILIPFAGRVRAVGRTPNELGLAISRALKEKAVDPQVLVAITRNVANTVTVTGAVNKPSIVPLTYKGDDLLDVIASVGGSRYPAYESRVSLTRNGRIAKAYLSHILNSPKDNIYLKRGDKINVARAPQSFSSFGAVIKKGKIDFGAAKLSVLEAVGKVSGLADNRADPRGVFVMRFEPREVAFKLSGVSRNEQRRYVPVIYRINLKDPNQYFFAQVIPLQDKDVIYVSNAPSVELDKFLTILGKAVGTGRAVGTLSVP